jgi:hypothetical protein
MGYVLRMSDEMHDWLIDLGRGDRATARLVAEALTVLLSEGERLGPPLAVPLADSSRSPDLAETLDRSYQRGLELLQASRRRAMDASTVTRRVREQIASLDPQSATREQEGELRRQLAAATETEQRLTEQSIRLQGRADAFRTTKEVLKARHMAARAEAAAQEVLADTDPGSSSGDRGLPEDEERDVADSIRTIEQEMKQELRTAPWAQVGELGPAPGLMELRPGAPGASEVSILFAIEPPGAVQLLSVLEGRDALRDYRDEAILLSSELLQRVRAGQAPEAEAHAYRDASSFLGEFFPGETRSVLAGADTRAGADALAAGDRARTLAELRTRLGLTQAQVAARMNVAQDTVSAIEQAGIGTSDVRTLAAYIEALGGRLEITADVGGNRVVLG